jgi:hypothetical protein
MLMSEIVPWTPNLQDPLLGPIKRLIAKKSPSEILAVRDEIASMCSSLEGALPARAITAASAAERERLSRHRRELAFLNAIVDGRAVRSA